MVFHSKLFRQVLPMWNGTNPSVASSLATFILLRNRDIVLLRSNRLQLSLSIFG